MRGNLSVFVALKLIVWKSLEYNASCRINIVGHSDYKMDATPLPKNSFLKCTSVLQLFFLDYVLRASDATEC